MIRVSDHPVRDSKEAKHLINVAATPPREEGNKLQPAEGSEIPLLSEEGWLRASDARRRGGQTSWNHPLSVEVSRPRNRGR